MESPAQAKRHPANKLLQEDKAGHDWYRFVLSFPPHLVRQYTAKFNVASNQRVLDPFCGTGTTLVECKKQGIRSIGIEANPVAYFASQVKTDWTINPDELLKHSYQVAEETLEQLQREGIVDDPLCYNLHQTVDGTLRGLDAEREKLLLTNSISTMPLHKALTLRSYIHRYNDSPFFNHQWLAFAKTLTFSVSNLHFGPEVGIGRQKTDAPVVAAWLENIRQMAHDLRALHQHAAVESVVYHRDARSIVDGIEPGSIDVVFTSPPYPNEKDYTRTTRLEAVMLGFVNNRRELQALKQTLVRSNTRGIYSGDDDDEWVEGFPEIQRIASLIETRRVQLGKTSGFERLYARTTKLYFGGMARHLANLRAVLKPGAQLGYVVGDQASYLQVMIRTGQILGTIAQSLGYEVVGIDLFRTRLATATKEQLREEVLLLRWPG